MGPDGLDGDCVVGPSWCVDWVLVCWVLVAGVVGPGVLGPGVYNCMLDGP